MKIDAIIGERTNAEIGGAYQRVGGWQRCTQRVIPAVH